MNLRTKYKRYFRTACTTLLLLAFVGCAKDKLAEYGSGDATGKVVMVSLKVGIPPAIEPASTSGYAAAKPLFRDRNDSGLPFTVALEQGQEPHEVTTRASDGTTKLHNLWLFQFDEHGSINGNPHKLSDAVTAINDLMTIDVPLVVSENQTLYLLVLGPKLNYDMSGVSTLDELKNWSFDYLINVEGHTQSLITADDEVPLAGEVSGVTVVDIDGGKRGLVEYNKPPGFVGGIEIERLMARVTLRYKFEVENYRLQGLKLLNVNNTIRLTNPEKNTDADTYATFEMDQLGEPDSNGYYSATWYVAQNRQGTVTTILSESQRYYKVVNKAPSGAAPPLGTQIEAWAYPTTGTDEYAIYQMYVGNNNTDNFDVEPNHFYNLRTAINAEINSAKNDERIRAYTTSQYVEFFSSLNVKASGASFSYTQYNKAGVDYDLDAAYSVRPIVIQTQGRKVEVEIYTDADCTQRADEGSSWLLLSSSSNYTDAFNNVKEPLDTRVTASSILPTQVKFYLYNKEYIYDDDGKLVDPGESDKSGKRSLYIKVTTTTEGEGETLQTFHIFRLDQRPAVYAGCFGGERDTDGNYTMGLVHDRPKRSVYQYDVPSGKLEYGYNAIVTADYSYGTDDVYYGKTATVNLAENIKNLTWSGNIPVPQKDASGHILLYQYQHPASTFSARACYDKNRDEDGNGRIEGEELKWYLPASNQLIGLYIGSPLDASSGQTITEDGSTSAKRWYYGLNSYYKTEGSARCVRDIPLPSVTY
ncbi:DUF4906 domain-containing protein [Bacteroides sp.]|uniref:DUF4906 domain-containing protein n=1 Tax=Bacteroides sp. TaxID=29523 RepID=UPI0025BC05D4|nr:DUF4906 domain-containing protein [Bacteroides sp.]